LLEKPEIEIQALVAVLRREYGIAAVDVRAMDLGNDDVARTYRVATTAPTRGS